MKEKAILHLVITRSDGMRIQNHYFKGPRMFEAMFSFLENWIAQSQDDDFTVVITPHP